MVNHPPGEFCADVLLIAEDVSGSWRYHGSHARGGNVEFNSLVSECISRTINGRQGKTDVCLFQTRIYFSLYAYVRALTEKYSRYALHRYFANIYLKTSSITLIGFFAIRKRADDADFLLMGCLIRLYTKLRNRNRAACQIIAQDPLWAN